MGFEFAMNSFIGVLKTAKYPLPQRWHTLQKNSFLKASAWLVHSQ